MTRLISGPIVTRLIDGPIRLYSMSIIPANEAMPGCLITSVSKRDEDMETETKPVCDDTEPSVEVIAPTEPGFYQYSGGAQTMLFLLDQLGGWWVIIDNGSLSRCAWGYIEQALGVWDLLPIESKYEGKRQ